MQVEQTNPPRLFPLVATLFGLVIALHLGSALVGRPLFRPIHLSTALTYADGQINLLRPQIVGFNANESPVAQEPPLWQAAAGLAFKLTHSRWYGWANVVSLLVFATGFWPFWQLARQYIGERPAWWALAFLLAQPIIVLSAGMAATDGLCFVLSIWFLYFADRMIRSGSARWWLPTALLACLAATSKMPMFMAAGLCTAAMLLANRIRSWRTWLLLGSVGGFAAGVFTLWTHYTNSLLAHAEYLTMELRLSESPQMVYWYFGNRESWLSAGAWLKGGWRVLHATLGSLPLVIIPLATLLIRGAVMLKLWLLATLLTALVFSQIILANWHYYLMCCPVVAMLAGATLARWENLLAQDTPLGRFRRVLAGTILALAALDGLITMKISVLYDSYPREMSDIIREHTTPRDKLIVYSEDWSGEVLFRSGRKGFHVMRLHQGVAVERGLFEMLTSETDMRRLKELGYTKLVLLSESPVRFAAEAVNPGSRKRREHYPATISPAVDAWPLVFRSDDIEIKEIP